MVERDAEATRFFSTEWRGMTKRPTKALGGGGVREADGLTLCDAWKAPNRGEQRNVLTKENVRPRDEYFEGCSRVGSAQAGKLSGQPGADRDPAPLSGDPASTSRRDREVREPTPALDWWHKRGRCREDVEGGSDKGGQE